MFVEHCSREKTIPAGLALGKFGFGVNRMFNTCEYVYYEIAVEC